MKKKAISKKSEGDPDRLAAMTEGEIDLTDIPEIQPEQFVRAVVREGLKPTAPKAQLTLRIARDVLERFRKQGRGYQTRINTLLRAYMKANKENAA